MNLVWILNSDHFGKRNNDMLISWILNIVSEQISNNLNFINSVSKLWVELQEHYAQIDGHRIYQLTNDIIQLKQANCTVEIYYHKLKGFLDEFDALESPYMCVCVPATVTMEGSMVKGETNKQTILHKGTTLKGSQAPLIQTLGQKGETLAQKEEVHLGKEFIVETMAKRDTFKRSVTKLLDIQWVIRYMENINHLKPANLHMKTSLQGQLTWLLGRMNQSNQWHPQVQGLTNKWFLLILMCLQGWTNCKIILIKFYSCCKIIKEDSHKVYSFPKVLKFLSSFLL